MSGDLSGARWFKSSHSSGSQECVEVAHLEAGMVGVRDSKNPAGSTLVYPAATWHDFTAALRSGLFTVD
nr:DUF397 domain-containing protein [Nocardia sienata]